MLPVEVPTVAIYAGDTTVFPAYTFKDAGVVTDLSGWTGWVATWRVRSSASESILMAVDISKATGGVIILTASSAQTRAMNGPGIWDLQATRGEETRTFLRGATTYVRDVSRD